METILGLYSDYFLCNMNQTTSTGLSTLVNDSSSSNQAAQFLSKQDFDKKGLGY